MVSSRDGKVKRKGREGARRLAKRGRKRERGREDGSRRWILEEEREA